MPRLSIRQQVKDDCQKDESQNIRLREESHNLILKPAKITNQNLLLREPSLHFISDSRIHKVGNPHQQIKVRLPETIARFVKAINAQTEKHEMKIFCDKAHNLPPGFKIPNERGKEHQCARKHKARGARAVTRARKVKENQTRRERQKVSKFVGFTAAHKMILLPNQNYNKEILCNPNRKSRLKIKQFSGRGSCRFT